MYQLLEKSIGQWRNFSFSPTGLRVGGIGNEVPAVHPQGGPCLLGEFTSRLEGQAFNADQSNTTAHNHCVILPSPLNGAS